jgi:LDH2 family malate/lactate/ureidoglycolate dehydrogenase
MNIGHYFQAIDVAAFMPVDAFRKRVDELVRQMKSSKRAPDAEQIMLPGEIEMHKAARYGREGIPMPAPVVEELQLLAQELDPGSDFTLAPVEPR